MRRTQTTLWSYFTQDKKRMKEFGSLLGTAIVIVTFFVNLNFQGRLQGKS